MRLNPASVIFCAVTIFSASAFEIGNETLIFRKCCPDDQVLTRVLEIDENGTTTSGNYECFSSNAYTFHNVVYSPLILGNNLIVEYGVPQNCNELVTSEMQFELFTSDSLCYDTLVEIVNDSSAPLKPIIPKTIALTCNKTDDVIQSMLKIENIRKCCRKGQAYDTEYHLCRDIEIELSDRGILQNLNAGDNFIYEVETGLHCKHDQYAVELKEELFNFHIKGSSFVALSRKESGGGRSQSGDWCIEEEYSGKGLVAQVCTYDCSMYDAFCMRKCCPIGQHFLPFRCGSPASKCVPNVDDSVLYNVSKYLNPLRDKDEHLLDSIGFQSGFQCPNGKFTLNMSQPLDRHRLTPEGYIEMPKYVGNVYCIEAFDNTKCMDEVTVTAVLCFHKDPETKNFKVSLIMIILSAVCLSLTLIVYCSLPELWNLHGRTLICHAAMMLIAYSCLARVQYGIVTDNRVCTVLGYGIYFGFVAAFAWLNVMCFDIWWTFGSVRTVQPLRKAGTERRRFLWYSLYAWGLAILFTLVMFLLDKYPIATVLDANIGSNVCWFSTLQNSQADWPHYIFFVIPMGLVVCVNFTLWVLTARHCARVKSEVHRLQSGSVGDRAKRRFQVDRAKYILTGKLWVVMGAGWVSELLSTVAGEPYWFWNIIDLFNELQGVFIFLILVFKPKVYYLIRKRLGLEKPDAQKNNASSSGRTSSTFLSRTISSDERNHLKTGANGKLA